MKYSCWEWGCLGNGACCCFTGSLEVIDPHVNILYRDIVVVNNIITASLLLLQQQQKKPINCRWKNVDLFSNHKCLSTEGHWK